MLGKSARTVLRKKTLSLVPKNNFSSLKNVNLSKLRELKSLAPISYTVSSPISLQYHNIYTLNNGSTLKVNREQNQHKIRQIIKVGRITKRSFSSYPPHEVVGLPALSPTMEQGTIANWNIEEGSEYSAGDVICEIETDKATVAFEAQDDGVLAKILVQPGTEVKVGEPIMVTVEDGDVSAFSGFVLDGSSASSSSNNEESTASTSTTTSAPSEPAIDYPPHEVVGLPALSPTMEQGTIASWNVEEGKVYSAGDVICEIETDKATVAFEAQDDAVLAKILVQAGTEVKVGEPIMVTIEEGDDPSPFANFVPGEAISSSSDTSSPPSPPSSSPEPTVSTSSKPTSASTGGRIFASPLAKKLAKEKGYDLAAIKGSGPNGRIVAEDVNAYTPSVASTPTPPASTTPSIASTSPSSEAVSTTSISTAFSTDVSVSPAQKLMAELWTESKRSVPHYYLTVDLNLSAAKILMERDETITVTGILAKAMAKSCAEVPDANASWMGETVRMYKGVDINLIQGSSATLLQEAHVKGIKELSTLATEGSALTSLTPPPATISLIDLGGIGVKNCAPIVTPGQAVALGVGCIEDRVIVSKIKDPETGNLKDGWSVAPMTTVTLSCDHRVIDGAVGAAWLAAFKKMVEDPMNIVL